MFLLGAVSLAVGISTVSVSTQATASAELGRRSLHFLATHSQDKDPEIRLEVAAAWGEIGNPAAKKLLLKALKDANVYVRIQAAVSLNKLGDPQGLSTLESIVRVSSQPASGKAKKDANPAEEMRVIARDKARTHAILRLPEFESEQSVSILESTLADPAGSVRDACAVALARMGFEEFAEQFLAAADDPDANLRAAAVRSLGEIGAKASLEILKRLAGDRDPGVRAEVMRSLGRFPDLGVVDLLAKGVKDDNPRVKLMAAASLAKLPDYGAEKILRGLGEQTGDAKPQAALIVKITAGLARRGLPVDLPLLEDVIKHSDLDLKLEAVEALKAVPGDAALELLGRTIDQSPDKRVRIRAAASLVYKLQRRGS